MSDALAAVLCALALGVGVLAQAPTEIAGTWKSDLAKSTFSPGPAPKSMSIAAVSGNLASTPSMQCRGTVPYYGLSATNV